MLLLYPAGLHGKIAHKYFIKAVKLICIKNISHYGNSQNFAWITIIQLYYNVCEVL